MAVPVQQNAFTIGEVGPALYGRTDLARYHLGASTFRNGFVSYRGGYYSRAGTKFVGYSKQTGRQFPPRLIPYQFSLEQGLALEFGNLYMRVIIDGAFATESPFQITGITQANPGVVTFSSLSTLASAVPINGGVVGSYARGDHVTLAGGVFVTPAVIHVASSTLAGLTLNAAGTGYVIGDRLTLAGGTTTLAPVLTVLTIGGGGAIATFAISNGGQFTANGPGTFTQASTTGVGTGATFKTGIFGIGLLAIDDPGSYSGIPGNPVAQASTTGVGTGVVFTATWNQPGSLANGDWIQPDNVGGMTEINGQTYVVTGLVGNTFQLYDVFGTPIDTSGFHAWTAGGTIARIFTLTTPYREEDLSFLKFTQSADVMSICLVNQTSGDEYPPLDLTRLSDTSWTLDSVVPATTVNPPATVTCATSSAGSTDYSYVVTAVSPDDATESVASPIGSVTAAVNVASTAGTITVTWTPVDGVQEYNVYKATPGLGVLPPAGSLFGFAGSAYGNQFLDSNVVADFVQVPPLHDDPFAPGKLINVKPTAGGAGYTTAAAAINSVTGSGAVIQPVIVGGAVTAYIIKSGGQNYQSTDTVTVTGDGIGATATLVVGAQEGTYPGTVAYFQERRAYANTNNQPDDYFMSQPGAFKNFDRRIPTIDSDAIIGNPWSVQVNGIQFMVPMPGGLVVLTGLSAWQLTGTGGSSLNPQPLTPSSEQAQPQAYNGCSATVPPIKIDASILYVQAKGSIVRQFEYQYYTNIYTGADLTLNSPQLFNGFMIKEWAWCEEPFKALWAVRDDGTMISLTYLKPQEVAGWGRSDTNGFFESVCTVTEPPVDALYVATQRFIGAQNPYMVERMDDRMWSQVEDCWCVDCGLSLPQPTPVATLTASSATGLGSITGATGIIGGSGYSSATIAEVVDGNGQGPGTGAVPTLTIVGGVITAIAFNPGDQGTGYTNPALVITDPENLGSGAEATLTLNNAATFTADAAVFALGDVTKVIRMGGGIARITAFTDNQHVTVNILSPIIQLIPNSGGIPQPQTAGNWTMTAAVQTITGLNHLAGATVTGLADGNVIPPTLVSAAGRIDLATPASSVTVGLGFRAQLQSLYLDEGSPTIQGQRKKIAACTARIEGSRGIQIGSNQPDGSVQSPPQIETTWRDLAVVPDDGPNFPLKPYNALATPLRTGDIRVPVQGGLQTPGQVCLQQDYPLPMQVLALINEDLPGDTPSIKFPPKPQRGREA